MTDWVMGQVIGTFEANGFMLPGRYTVRTSKPAGDNTDVSGVYAYGRLNTDPTKNGGLSLDIPVPTTDDPNAGTGGMRVYIDIDFGNDNRKFYDLSVPTADPVVDLTLRLPVNPQKYYEGAPDYAALIALNEEMRADLETLRGTQLGITADLAKMKLDDSSMESDIDILKSSKANNSTVGLLSSMVTAQGQVVDGHTNQIATIKSDIVMPDLTLIYQNGLI